MKEFIMAILLGAFIGAVYTLGFYAGNEDKTCLDSEMQYFEAKCQWYQTKPDHKVCKAGEMVIYFNLTKEDNLTEEQIKELEERL